jgi:hypothetical protein
MLRRIFPNKYDLEEIKKYGAARACQFSDSRDAFQQLVGDALRYSFGNDYVFSSLTSGQDGSIDSYVENYSNSPFPPFDKMELPIIVECKSNQPSDRIDENIQQEWDRLKKKLIKQSENGWAKLFVPWKSAGSYVYCVSANITPARYIKLTGEIKGFFDGLPPERRPPIENVLVLDWGKLRHWFNDIPQLCDLWLGINSSVILEHQRFRDSLEGFKQFLLPDRLGFVEPEPEAAFHPQKIFQRLKSGTEKNNILIVGAGGVGKTRTSTEVAALAAKEGWRVLHVLAAGESEVENEDLAEAVLPYSGTFPGKTLVIFDYVDQMNKLDLGYIRRSLIPEAKERGNELVVLANSRPGWMKLQNPERDELFFEVELKPSESQREKITGKVIDEIAPKACEKLGRDLVKELCGERSIIALLIALELERRAAGRGITKEEVSGIRQGDLVIWLRKRLSEGGFVAVQDNRGMAYPEPWLIISAAVLACAPERKDFLLDIADEVRRATGANENSEFIVDTLINLGWLERTSGFFSTPHDVVADEVFDQAVHFEKYVHRDPLRQILTPSASHARCLGKFATTFERVLGAIHDEETYGRVKQEAETWLSENAAGLGEFLVSANSGESSYSIGAVLSGDLWRENALDNWSELVNPWLSRHGTEKEARHLLYKGLKKISSIEKIDLLNLALNWLNTYSQESEADYIIGSLLTRKELTREQAEQAIKYAFDWLKEDNNYLKLGSQFVLRSLLEREELTKEQPKKAIEYAFDWLEEDNNYLKFEARFVLQPLLSRKELTKEQPKKAIEYAFDWLEEDNNYLKFESQFVYNQLLTREELTKVEAEKAIEYAFKWLKEDDNYLKLEASFVLPLLLARKELTEEQAEKVIEYALKWLRKDATALILEAGFVLPPLLLKIEDFDAKAAELILKSVHWLEKYFDTQDAEFVIRKLFKRKDVDRRTLEDLIRAALERLKRRLNDEEATYLINSCLRPKIENIGLEIERLKVAVDWLKLNPLSEDAEFVWNKVLRNNFTTDKDWEETSNIALRWLKTRDFSEVDYTINSLLTRPNLLSVENFRYVIERGLEWITANRESKTAREISGIYNKIKLALKNSPNQIQPENLVSELNDIAGQTTAIKQISEKKKIGQRFWQVKNRLETLAQDSIIVIDAAEMKEICEVIEKQLSYSAKSASYTIMPLLLAGLRCEKDIFEIVSKTVELLMSAQNLSDAYKEEVTLIISTLLQQNLFVLSPDAETWLEKLGINPTAVETGT